jgi:hypothetical protein
MVRNGEAMRSTIVKQAFIVSIGSCILNWPAFINGYLFIFSDSSSHIVSATTASVDIYRGVSYGWLLIPGLMAGNMYIIAFTQAMLYSLLIWWIVGHYIQERTYPVFFIIITALSLFTSLSWLCGTLLPDAFTGMMLLSVWLLLVMPVTGNRIKLSICGLVLFYAVTVHLSHMAWIAGMAAALPLLRLIFQKHFTLSWRRYFVILAIACISLLSVPVVNRIYTGRFYITQSSSFFMMGKLWGNGLLEKYLDDNCGGKQWIMCEYRGKVHGTTKEFLWSDRMPYRLNSKIWKDEKYRNWQDEFQPIIRETLLHYPVSYLALSIPEMLKLSVNIGLDERIYLTPYTSIVIYIRDRIPEEVKKWEGSLIYRNRMPAWLVSGTTWSYRVLLMISALSLLVYAWHQRRRSEDLFIMALFFISYFGHALIFALLSESDPVRYQSRMGWCVIALALVLWARYAISSYQDFRARCMTPDTGKLLMS